MKKIILGAILLFSVISCTADKTDLEQKDSIIKEDPITLKSIGKYFLGTEITSKKGIYAVQGDSINKIDLLYKYAQHNQVIQYGNYANLDNELLQEPRINKDTGIITQHGINFLQYKLRFFPIISNIDGKMILSSCAFNYDNGTNNITIQNDNWKGWDRIYLDFSNKGYIIQWRVYSSSSLPKASWTAYHITYYY